MSLLVLTAFGYVRSLWRAQRAIESEPTLSEQAGALLDLIDRDLRRLPRTIQPPEAVRFAASDEGGAFQVDFTSHADSVDTETARPSDLAEVGYELRADPRRPGWLRLYRRVDPSPDDESREGGTLTLLSDRVLALGWRFHSPGAPVDDSGWKETWAGGGEEGVPDLVEMTLTLGLPPADRGGTVVHRTFRMIVPTDR
ncbi:MAG: hypothetical protein HY608_05045 [Planctomycetes bacterium]|nr:hypothetical protein [Planctomycetota bacterium]